LATKQPWKGDKYFVRTYREEEEVWGLQWMHSTWLWSVQQLQSYEKVWRSWNQEKVMCQPSVPKAQYYSRPPLQATVKETTINH